MKSRSYDEFFEFVKYYHKILAESANINKYLSEYSIVELLDIVKKYPEFKAEFEKFKTLEQMDLQRIYIDYYDVISPSSMLPLVSYPEKNSMQDMTMFNGSEVNALIEREKQRTEDTEIDFDSV